MVCHPILLRIFNIVMWGIVVILLIPHIVRWWKKKYGSKEQDNSKNKES